MSDAPNVRLWTISVLVLSVPSLLFVPLHLLYRPGQLSDCPDLLVTWAMSLTGMCGGLTTIAAFIVAVVASFQQTVSGNDKVIVWSFTALSLLASWYIAQVPP